MNHDVGDQAGAARLKLQGMAKTFSAERVVDGCELVLRRALHSSAGETT